MWHTKTKNRLAIRGNALIATVAIIAALIPQSALAAKQDALLELRPHCSAYSTGDERNDDWMLGPIPSPGIVAETGDGEERVSCTEFAVLDPVTRKTEDLRIGDILHIDVLIVNPTRQGISRTRAWLSYDPNILEGILLKINESAFPEVTPDENDFFPEEGYVKMEASAGEAIPDTEHILFAEIEFRVLKTTPSGSPITFHDVQPAGHTEVAVNEGGTEISVLQDEPGVLKVMFDTTSADSVASETSVSSSSAASEASVASETSSGCAENDDCLSGLCIGGQCREPQAPVGNGGSCTFDADCQSNLCSSGICVPKITEEPATEPSPVTSAQLPSQETRRTAFSLLQVRNLRVTTEGGVAFLAWDHLQSSALKAYNVYYGTTSGRYIQRKTVDGSSNSLTIRSLPVGTQYFFAVRAVSTDDEESAFSQEVAVVIGDATTSTAPLAAGLITNPGPNGVNPIGGITTEGHVPGETGIPSFVLMLMLASAVTGTVLAARRQWRVAIRNPLP